MKAITLYQPWATLMAIGAKRIETRIWRTNYHGPLAIHAGLNKRELEYCFVEPFSSVLLAAGIHKASDLPLGAIVGICDMVNCIPTRDLVQKHVDLFLNNNELAFGDYGPGRYGWITSHMQRLEEPIPALGKQGLWNWIPHGLFGWEQRSFKDVGSER